jgi:Zn-dependent protease with chaperone function
MGARVVSAFEGRVHPQIMPATGSSARDDGHTTGAGGTLPGPARGSEVDALSEIETSYRYEQISPKAYEHPADRAATSALHAVPLLDTVIKRLIDLGHEKRLRQVVRGNAVKVGPDQLPEIWRRYVQVSSVLDLPATPDLFVYNQADVNAMTLGANKPIVVVNSSLVSSYTIDEVQTVLAHEAGHVLSEHYYYTTALVLLGQFVNGSLPKSLLLGLPARAIYYALLEWARAAELSSDRAAALVRADPLDPCRVMMRMAGGALPGMDFEAFLKQCTEYQGEDDLFSRHARFWAELKLDHPFAVRRVKELVEWVQSGEYDRIRAGSYPRRGHEPAPSAEFQAAVDAYKAKFTRFFERTAGDVQRLGRQLSDWLKTRVPASGTEEE